MLFFGYYTGQELICIRVLLGFFLPESGSCHVDNVFHKGFRTNFELKCWKHTIKNHKIILFIFLCRILVVRLWFWWVKSLAWVRSTACATLWWVFYCVFFSISLLSFTFCHLRSPLLSSIIFYFFKDNFVYKVFKENIS